MALRLTLAERDLILAETFIGSNLIEPLQLAPLDGKSITVLLSLDDLDDLAGHVAAQANHAEDRRLQRRLDATYSKIRKVEAQYADPLSPDF